MSMMMSGPANSGNLTPYSSPMGRVNLTDGASWRDYYKYMQKIHTQQGASLGAAMDQAFMQNNKSIDEPIIPTIGGGGGAGGIAPNSGGPGAGSIGGGGGGSGIGGVAAAGLGAAAAMQDNGNEDSQAAYQQWLLMQQRQKAEQARLQQISQQNAQSFQQMPAAPDQGLLQAAAILKFQASQMLQPTANPGLRSHKVNTGGPTNTGRSMLLGG